VIQSVLPLACLRQPPAPPQVPHTAILTPKLSYHCLCKQHKYHTQTSLFLTQSTLGTCAHLSFPVRVYPDHSRATASRASLAVNLFLPIAMITGYLYYWCHHLPPLSLCHQLTFVSPGLQSGQSISANFPVPSHNSHSFSIIHLTSVLYLFPGNWGIPFP
jgi:hypothetical protein